MVICELGRPAAVVLWPEQQLDANIIFLYPSHCLYFERNRGMILQDNDGEGEVQMIVGVS